MRIHRPELPQSIDPDKAILRFGRTGILHFDGYSSAHWGAKIRGKRSGQRHRRGYNPGRVAQIEAVAQAGADAAKLAALYRALKQVIGLRIALLVLRWRVLPVRFDIDAALKGAFPDYRLDLSPSAIEARLDPESEKGAGKPAP